MKVNVILNPTARKNIAVRRRAAVTSALEAVSLSYRLTVTRTVEEACEQAQLAAARGFDAVVAAGGDGTVHTVANGLISATNNGARTLPLGILPLGTGNDFAEMAGLPGDLRTAAAVIAAGHVERIDAGLVTYWLPNEPHAHGCYFVNNCAVAMEPLVTLESARVRGLLGKWRYVVGVLRGFVRLRPWQMRISWHRGSFSAATYLLSVANTPRTGGQFMVAPGARLDDGLLDVVHAPVLPRWQVLALLPRLIAGTHVQHPSIRTEQTTCLDVESDPPTPVHADGELLCAEARHVRCQILPGKLSLLVP
ncbi:MAG: diacylglycerol kinase family lipid kinase [Candidatus Promineifilaceae bacterium]|nr:diacylglycerol kinase family lipid kinase [Candidatus Promineifilaceae bacterium]